MPLSTAPGRGPLNKKGPRASPRLVHTTYDSHGQVLANYTFYDGPHILYVRWVGHFTGADFVHAATIGLALNERWQPRGLFHDQRGSSGEWGGEGAAEWHRHEWIPGIQAACPNLRGIALLRDADALLHLANLQALRTINEEFTFQQFYALPPAWRWMLHVAQSSLRAPG